MRLSYECFLTGEEEEVPGSLIPLTAQDSTGKTFCSLRPPYLHPPSLSLYMKFADVSLSEEVKKQCSGQSLQGSNIVSSLLSSSYYSTRSCMPPLLSIHIHPQASVICPMARSFQSLLHPNSTPGPQLPKSQPERYFTRTLANLERQGTRRQGNKTMFLVEQHESAAPPSGAAGRLLPGGDIFRQSISHY